MNCHRVQKSVSAFLDQSLPEHESAFVSQHLTHCRECAIYSEDLSDIRRMMRELPMLAPPRRLTSELQVLASHERARRLSRMSFSAAFHYWKDRARLMVDNLMRPFALPFAGGLVSALVLFSTLVPTLGFQVNRRNDVPTLLSTEASVESLAPFALNNDEIAVELMIDERGTIVNYSFPQGQVNREVLNNIENMILFTTFNPATSFGQPTLGKIRISFRRSHIVVKG